MVKILISGLSGSGKTTLAKQLSESLPNCVHINADEVRAETNNWDFSIEGRMKQVHELIDRANVLDCDYVIFDFIAPLKEIRDLVNADYTIWMNTVENSEYADTDELYQPFVDATYIITEFSDGYARMLSERISCVHTSL